MYRKKKELIFSHFSAPFCLQQQESMLEARIRLLDRVYGLIACQVLIFFALA